MRVTDIDTTKNCERRVGEKRNTKRNNEKTIDKMWSSYVPLSLSHSLVWAASSSAWLTGFSSDSFHSFEICWRLAEDSCENKNTRRSQLELARLRKVLTHLIRFLILQLSSPPTKENVIRFGRRFFRFSSERKLGKYDEAKLSIMKGQLSVQIMERKSRVVHTLSWRKEILREARRWSAKIEEKKKRKKSTHFWR